MVGALTELPRPTSRAALADLVVDLAVAASADAAARGVAVRVAVDAADSRDGSPLGDEILARLAALGRPVARVSTADFLARRSIRLEYGPNDSDAAYERWVDWAALAREVLDPLADAAAPRWLPRLWDAEADRPTREAVRAAVPGTIAVVDGPYLLRWELSGGFDLAVHLAVSAAALLRRFPAPGDPRPTAWARYLDECDPAARATVVARYDRPDHPALLTSGPLHDRDLGGGLVP